MAAASATAFSGAWQGNTKTHHTSRILADSCSVSVVPFWNLVNSVVFQYKTRCLLYYCSSASLEHLLISASTTMALLPYALLFCLPAFALPQPMMARDPEPSIQWIDCRDQVPFTLDTTDINMNALPDTLHCGSLIVPMDYSKSIGKDNNITLGLAMYRPKNPKGVVFL